MKLSVIKKSSLFLLLFSSILLAQQPFNGLNMNLGNLSTLSNAKTRSISPENLTGEKGKGGMATLENGIAAKAARELGQGWKVNPYVHIKHGEELVLAEIEGSGAIQHIWMTTEKWRFAILRIYWDDETEPSVEVPVGDFFASAYGYKQISSLPISVNSGSGFNSFWVMPFRKKCKITMENISDGFIRLYYQVDYTLTDVPKDAAYFHAQFRRTNPIPYKDVYTVVDGIKGKGHYVGTYMAWQSNNSGWWGEGEIKFFMDGDDEFPTICGTGTEDYFLGSFNFEVRNKATNKREYKDYTTPYAGFAAFLPEYGRSIAPKDFANSQTRFSMYRWHIMDPIRFENNLKITIQALGWRGNRTYMPLQDDISSVAIWYQVEPHAKFPKLPNKNYLEIR